MSTSPGTGSFHLAPAPSPQGNGAPLMLPGSVHPHGHLQTMPHPETYYAYGAQPPHNMWPSVLPSSAKEGSEKVQFGKYVASGSSPCGSSDLCNPNTSMVDLDTRVRATNSCGGNYSHITEDCMGLHAATVGHTGPTWTYSHEVRTSARLETPLTDRKRIEAGVDGFAEEQEAMPSCSGGSQSSAEFSAKETSSMGKEKADEFDCQSKDAEVDSSELSQLRKRTSKRRRVAESHNLSEKRRRNRINERLRTLQELIPNSTKTDKASVLDETIEYLKALQSQLQMMSSRSGMRFSPVVLPTGMDHLKMGQMAPVHPMGFGVPYINAGVSRGLGRGVMDFTHGMTRPFQAFSAVPTHGNLAYPIPAAVSTQACGRSLLSMEPLQSGFWAFQQQASVQHAFVEPQKISSVEMHQSEEQLLTSRNPKDR